MLAEPKSLKEHKNGPIIQLFSNQRSGGYSRRRIEALITAFKNGGATVLHCETGDGTPIIDPDATNICIAAGDGTVRHVAGAVAQTGNPIALSIYPIGTINLLAREANHPVDPTSFVDLVLSGKSRRPHFPVEIGDSHFFACAGVGPDSFGVARVSTSLKKIIGRLAYVVAMLPLLKRWPRHHIVLDADGCKVCCEAFYVAKGRYYAGGWSFALGARVGQPLLHVVAMPTARRRDYARFLLSLAFGSQQRSHPALKIFTCKTLIATSDEALPIQADGDIVGTLPATMAVSGAPVIFC